MAGNIEEILRSMVREEVARALAELPPHREVIVFDSRRLYSVAEVADLLRCSTDYVYDRINRRELASVDLGSTRGKQRVSAAALQAFIDSRAHG